MSWIKLLLNKAEINSSLRKIQLQFLGILLIVAISFIGYKCYTNIWSLHQLLLSIGIILIITIVIIIKPVVLKPVLFFWLLLGLILGKITSTIVLGFIFYFLFFPITFIIRVKNRKKNKHKTGWFSRESDVIDYRKFY